LTKLLADSKESPNAVLFNLERFVWRSFEENGANKKKGVRPAPKRRASGPRLAGLRRALRPLKNVRAALMAAVVIGVRARRQKFQLRMSEEKAREFSRATEKFQALDAASVEECRGQLSKSQLRELLVFVHPTVTIEEPLVEYA
jgi:hypothetical protein